MKFDLEEWKADGPIRKWRTRARISQHELAVRLDAQSAQVANWEAGRNFPSWDRIVDLAVVFERNAAGLEHALRTWWLANPANRIEEEATT